LKTAKEKAKELIEIFKSTIDSEIVGSTCFVGGEPSLEKQCATICVREIINAFMTAITLNVDDVRFFIDIQTEINNYEK